MAHAQARSKSAANWANIKVAARIRPQRMRSKARELTQLPPVYFAMAPITRANAK